MKVCLDTNVFVQIFSARSPFIEILQALVHGHLHLEIPRPRNELVGGDAGARPNPFIPDRLAA